MFLWKHIGVYSGWTVFMIMVNNGVQAWKYNYSTNNMEWKIARQWCKQHYTDIVAIQNKDEVRYLNQNLPFRTSYYWIGLRKLAGQWTWMGTMKPLAPEAASWAKGEPNDRGTNEDCVEIYIKRTRDSGMWNDDRCSKEKAALCFTASCVEGSCSEHGECVENIGSFICKCNAGFTGPRCDEVVECRPITSRTSGWNMTCSHPLKSNSYTSTCVFSCEEGFELRGSNTTVCDHTGQWTHTTPTCTAVTCDPVVSPQKGIMKCTDPLGTFSFRSRCDVSCEEGYKLKGKKNLTCLKTGNWSAETPACEVVRCGALNAVPHGSTHCTDSLGKFTYGSVCEFECDVGFLLMGSNYTHCISQGNWSHSLPVCQVVQCPPLSAHFSDGKMNCTHPLSTNSYNSTCVFNCDEGFQLIGSNNTQCDHAGQWTPKTPTCKAVTCDPVVSPQKGIMKCTDPLGTFSFRSRCDVSCEEGYKLKGEKNLTCLKTGNWSAETPACEAVTCDPVVSPQKGIMKCTDPLGTFSFRSRCDVSCEEGYKLKGEKNLTCLKTGNWSAETPACEVVRCGALNAVPHGSTHCTDSLGKFTYGSVCEFECDVGFLLMGSNYTHCISQGNWSHSLPVCQVVQCPPLSAHFSDGKMNCTHPLSTNSYNSTCVFNCDEGFQLIGSNNTQCDHAGQWTPKTPTCKAVTCDPVVSPQKGIMKCTDPLGTFSFRSRCDVSCEEGYKLKGEKNLTCLKTGNWSAETPACEVVRCGALNAVPHGSTHCTDSLGKFTYGSVCEFECDVGFLLMGSNYTHCISQGNWSHSLPVCQVVQCPPLSAHFSDGKMNCTHPLSTNSYNSTCVFNCDEGFQLIGSNNTQCDHAGQWTPKTPTCKARQCPLLSIPENGWMNCSHPRSPFSYGSHCSFGCETGYLLREESQLDCTTAGTWSQETPSCQVEGMTVGTGFLVYGAIGATSALGLLLMGGLVMLMMRQFSKGKFTPDYTAWDGALNPAFEGL